MQSSRKSHSRRQEIRKNRPDMSRSRWQQMKADGSFASMAIAAIFVVVATCILSLREDVIPYRPGQFIPQDILSRVDFTFPNKELLNSLRQSARKNVPRVYGATQNPWHQLEDQLLELPDQMHGKTLEEVRQNLREKFHLDAGAPFITDLDNSAVTLLDQYSNKDKRPSYQAAVKQYIESLQKLVILPESQWQAEAKREADLNMIPRIITSGSSAQISDPIKITDSFSTKVTRDLLEAIRADADVFRNELQLKMVALTANLIQPTHQLDEDATVAAQNQAAQNVPPSNGEVHYEANQVLKSRGELDDRGWQILKAEHNAFLKRLYQEDPWERVKTTVGVAGIVILVTMILCGYISNNQVRIVRNHARGIALAVLLLAMLLLAQLSAIGTGPMFVFGIAPTIIVSMIIAIAYDRRFAMGIATMHAILVTFALNQTVGFFLILFIGVFTCCLLLDEIRTRSKLIEVGGATALAMILATMAVGAVSMEPIEPFRFISRNCLYAGAAGLAVGFIVLGILPFIEKAFRITTSMTLLELADASQPLLRRLALEAPGTYNHSLQVATLSEAAAESVGANSLLCRVGSYYHDIGKMNKADYFVENQSNGRNRHLNLSPSVSLLIIIGHVKDGVELAREYNLPTSLFPFIQQHHGTTLVEYFYHQACNKKDDQNEQPAISEMQYRYPGAKPKTLEIGIVMIADAVESATRAMGEPTASRIETLVHEIAMKRLLDGQLDECDMTMRELEAIEKSLVKTLLGIYHGRIAYPSTAATTTAPSPQAKTA
ncbi:MAG TPA: HDIG domain-containing metalloprotein [Tepidisphaeraceae bacterium]